MKVNKLGRRDHPLQTRKESLTSSTFLTFRIDSEEGAFQGRSDGRLALSLHGTQ